MGIACVILKEIDVHAKVWLKQDVRSIDHMLEAMSQFIFEGGQRDLLSFIARGLQQI